MEPAGRYDIGVRRTGGTRDLEKSSQLEPAGSVRHRRAQHGRSLRPGGGSKSIGNEVVVPTVGEAGKPGKGSSRRSGKQVVLARCLPDDREGK